MKKQEFLLALKRRLSGLPRQDVEERLGFYSEMIDDRIEEGLSEEDAVSAIGSADEVAGQIIADGSVAKIAKPKRHNALSILLLVLGSPIWLSLAVSAFAVVLSLYVSLWAVLISIWAAFASLACCGPCGAVVGIVFALGGNGPVGIATVGAGLVCTGLAIPLFFGCRAATRGTVLLSKKIALGIKKCFVKKEEA